MNYNFDIPVISDGSKAFKSMFDMFSNFLLKSDPTGVKYENYHYSIRRIMTREPIKKAALNKTFTKEQIRKNCKYMPNLIIIN